GSSFSLGNKTTPKNSGTRESFSAGFLVTTPATSSNHPEFGPFQIELGRQQIMQSSTDGFRPTEAAHIRDSALCATCHTLYTKSLGPGGKDLGFFPEQMPYLEWLHSDYPQKSTCQSCHMPEVDGEAPVAAVMGPLRSGMHQHTFTGGNFLVSKMLNLHRDELSVSALPAELSAEAERTVNFLQTQAAGVSFRNVNVNAGNL